MRSDNPATWTSTPVSAPADMQVTSSVGDRIADIVASICFATGGGLAMIYRQADNCHVLVGGCGPAQLSTRRLRNAFVIAADDSSRDFVQFADDSPVPNACAKLGLRGLSPTRFAAAVQIQHDGAYYGVLVLSDKAARPMLSAAQSYVLRAFAGQAAALFELEAARERATAADGDFLAKTERLRLFESVAVHARDSIVITEAAPLDRPGPRILYCNRAFTETTGYSAEEAIGQTPRMLQGPRTDPVALARIRAALETWQPIVIELINYRKDGTEFWVELSIVPVANEGGWYTHWVSVQRDITQSKQAEDLSARVRLAETENKALASEIVERKRVEAKLLYTAFHDNLTRLRNRAFFMDRLKAALDRRVNDPNAQCAVLFLDLDRFKIVNDSLGHQAGDLLLKEVSRRLKTCVRPQDTLARLGGDEFALLIDDGADLAFVTNTAERIIDALRAPIRIGRQEVFTSSSIGIVLSSERSSHCETIIRDADIAMYAAKRSGFGDYAVFGESMVKEAAAVMSLQADLQLGIERGEFELAYQPIVDPENGRIHGFEALIRWLHPTRGFVQPDQFVPVAEEMGLIRQIDRWVMHTACAQLADWRARFDTHDLSMSINTSASEFDDPGFLDELKATLARFDLPPHALELEITESIFLDPDRRISDIISAIRKYGVRIGLDDFGTGYSSLSYLNRYPTDTIKIDKSFVMSLCSDDRTLAIVLLIIQLAKTLHVNVVAEGVETEEQAQLLASMSCSHAQGFYFSRPITADAATSLMSSTMVLNNVGQTLYQPALRLIHTNAH